MNHPPMVPGVSGRVYHAGDRIAALAKKQGVEHLTTVVSGSQLTSKEGHVKVTVLNPKNSDLGDFFSRWRETKHKSVRGIKEPNIHSIVLTVEYKNWSGTSSPHTFRRSNRVRAFHSRCARG